jgi:transposase, IS5 family
MIRVAYAQRSLVEVLLPDGEKLWDPVLRRIDAELEDEGLLDVMMTALAQRRPLSSRRGRLGTPATVALRMLVLKHLFDWSFDECEREVRANLVYRAFCRIEGERVPDAKTLIRLAHVLDGPALKALLARLVVIAHGRQVVRGRRLRVDTTVVETTIHYPTDSTLLADGVRVLTRALKRLRTAVTEADAGFASRVNERAAHARGVHTAVLPWQRRRGRARRARAALKWRTGCEGRISALKRRHGLRRSRYRGLAGMQRWVGLGVIANNLLVLGRAGPRTR